MPRKIALVLLLCAFLMTPALADTSKNAIRLGLSYHMPDAEETVEIDEGDSLDLDADSATGAFIAYEYRFSKLLGLEAFVTRAEPELEAKINGDTEGKEDVDFTAATLGLNVHVFGRGAIDVYVAPLVGYAFYGSDFDDNVVYGAALGLELGFGDGGLAFTASARYLKSEAEAKDENIEIDFDPLIISAGLAYRF